MNDEIIVRLRRRILQRLTADVVVHWNAWTEEPAPSCGATGRSLLRVERALRKKLATKPEWDAARANAVRIVFELVDGAEDVRTALDTNTRAAAESRKADAAAEEASRAAVRLLLTGTPALSIRDAARMLGLPKSHVHRVAVELALADPAKKSRSRERTTALDARRIPPRPTAAAKLRAMHAAKKARGSFSPVRPDLPEPVWPPSGGERSGE